MRSLTFEDVENMSNQLANLLHSRGIVRGDTVALFMENRPEFIVSWLAITKLGGASRAMARLTRQPDAAKCAMINTSIVQKGLVHCIAVSGAKAVLFGTELEQALADVAADLPKATTLFCQGRAPALMATAEFVRSPRSCWFLR